MSRLLCGRIASASHVQALLPLVNVPMIDYVLEFLVANSVEEIFIFCSSKASQVRCVGRIVAVRHRSDGFGLQPRRLTRICATLPTTTPPGCTR
jgi:hypothetical protein